MKSVLCLATMVTVATFAWAPAASGFTPVPAGSWGPVGSANGEMEGAAAISVDAMGSVFITDLSALAPVQSRVQAFSLKGSYYTQWGFHGTSASFSGPFGVLAGDGVVYVVERNANRIQKFERIGVHITDFTGNLNGPNGICFDPSGDLWVADTGANRIRKLSATTGAVLDTWDSPGLFASPLAIAVSPTCGLYVVDQPSAGVGRVRRFGFNQALQDTWTFNGQPGGIAVDGRERVYATDATNDVVRVMDIGHNLISWGDLGEFESPRGIAIDPDGAIYVIDAGPLQVHKYFVAEDRTLEFVSHSFEERPSTPGPQANTEPPPTELPPQWISPGATTSGGWNFEQAGACNPAGWIAGGNRFAGRLLANLNDVDVCRNNSSCSWVWTDASTIACPGYDYGPFGTAVAPGTDEYIVSPWVNFTAGPYTNTALQYYVFPGNSFPAGRIVLNCSIRTRRTPGPGSDCGAVSTWKQVGEWNSLSAETWTTISADISRHVDLNSTGMQVRFRVSDWGPSGLGYATAGTACGRGPGPYVDQVRIGRAIGTGPTLSAGIDNRSQAQDAFATQQNTITPGQHFSPSTDILGTAAFSAGADLGVAGSLSPNLITADSIWVVAGDRRGVPLTSVRFYGAITAGPHVGKAPCPYTVGPNGFFSVNAEPNPFLSVPVPSDRYFVDLDDTYFRGGDELKYYWCAEDAANGRTTLPPSVLGPNEAAPASVQAAETNANGLFEVDFLPAINWHPTYLARIAADPCGDLEPDATERQASTQARRILYVQKAESARRSGRSNRTSMMWALDEAGYEGLYDVYDVQGFGNTNNELGGRATVAQAGGYQLIIHDAGMRSAGVLPTGNDLDNEKVNQAQWYRDYLTSGATSAVGSAALWLVGRNIVSGASHPLLSVDCAVSTPGKQGPRTGAGFTPDVVGIAPFTFPVTGYTHDFIGDPRFTVVGTCPYPGDFDALVPTAQPNATLTHQFVRTGTTGAVVMNKNPALRWTTIVSSFPWPDINFKLPKAGESSPGTASIAQALVSTVVKGTTGYNPCMVRPEDAVGWWRADGNGIDAARGHASFLRNGTTFRQGKGGTAFALDGVDDFVEVTNAPDLNPAAFTLQAWVYPTASGFNRCIFSHGHSCHPPRSWDLALMANGKLAFFFSPDGVASSQLESGAALSVNQWTHVAVTFAAGVATLYINAVPAGSQNFGAAVNQNTANLRIGAFYCNFADALARPFAGSIDNVGFHARALSAAEIATSYAVLGRGDCDPLTVDAPEPGDAVAGAPRSSIRSASPNPFNPSSRVELRIAQTGPVRLDVFDVGGRRVRRLIDEVKQAGVHQVVWDGRADGGVALPNGLYLLRLSAADGGAARKIVLVK